MCHFLCTETTHPHALNMILVIDVTGTSSGAEGDVVVDLVCSSECSNVTATGTDLTAPNGTAAFVCQNIDTTQVDAVFSLLTTILI